MSIGVGYACDFLLFIFLFRSLLGVFEVLEFTKKIIAFQKLDISEIENKF